MFEWLWNRNFNQILTKRNNIASEFLTNVNSIRDSHHELHPNIIEYSNALKDIMLVQNEYVEKKVEIMHSLKESSENLVVFYQLINDYDSFVKDMESVVEDLETFKLPYMNIKSNKIAKENINKINSIMDLNHILIKKVVAKCQTIPLVKSELTINDAHVVKYSKEHIFPE